VCQILAHFCRPMLWLFVYDVCESHIICGVNYVHLLKGHLAGGRSWHMPCDAHDTVLITLLSIDWRQCVCQNVWENVCGISRHTTRHRELRAVTEQLVRRTSKRALPQIVSEMRCSVGGRSADSSTAHESNSSALPLVAPSGRHRRRRNWQRRAYHAATTAHRVQLRRRHR
jgi:hypothetical protein